MGEDQLLPQSEVVRHHGVSRDAAVGHTLPGTDWLQQYEVSVWLCMEHRGYCSAVTPVWGLYISLGSVSGYFLHITHSSVEILYCPCVSSYIVLSLIILLSLTA